MRVAFSTFGCKINQYDSDQMRQAVAGEGNVIVPFEGDADIYIINTCSVTAKSDYQCRQAIRAAVRRSPAARVVVTGCYAETRPEEIRAIAGVAAVIGNREKNSILRYLPAGGGVGASPAAGAAAHFGGRTRRFLKIQDGCDSRCSYCIVPDARGASRSIPLQEVAAAFERFVGEGVPEIVLSGIHIGKYGSDLDPRQNLGALVGELVSRRRGARIRLSSIEPREVTAELVGFIGQGLLCRHLHIPLQSGDDEILRAMNRDYTAAFYRDLVASIARRVPGMALGADVMVGFPGEEERHFQNTLRLIEELPLSHLHVFSYSPRPGTPAANLPRQVNENIKKERNEMIRSIGLRKNIAFRKTMVGANVEVVLEGKLKDGGVVGLTDNYLKVTVAGADADQKSSLLKVNVENVDDHGINGMIIRK
jgi:threonylcarbamoyladenosine tRNA methylthiotransferase MtaB